MTLLAFFRVFDVSVIGVLVGYVLGYVFVTIFAQAGLCSLIKFLMTFRTFTFNFAMTLYDIARGQDIRDRIGLRRCNTNQQ
jgi:hypothetical protein